MEKIVILFFLALISFFTWYVLDKLGEEVPYPYKASKMNCI